MSMLVTLDEMKTRLGITNTDYDVFLTEQITVVSDSVEGYCGRIFASAAYVQNFYKADMESELNGTLLLFHYPVQSITSVKEVDNNYTLTSPEFRISKPPGRIKRLSGYSYMDWFYQSEEIEVTYTGGYTEIPSPVKEVVYSLVEERYNKKVSGVNLNFGNDVQRVSIPGTIAVDFDYSLQANERKASYGMILGNYLNVLDPYRSERSVIGTVRDAYVN